MSMLLPLVLGLAGLACSEPLDCGSDLVCRVECPGFNMSYCVDPEMNDQGCSDPPDDACEDQGEDEVPIVVAALVAMVFFVVGFGGIVSGIVKRKADVQERRDFLYDGAKFQGTVVGLDTKVEHHTNQNNTVAVTRHFLEAEYTCNDASQAHKLVTARKQWEVHQKTYASFEHGQSITIVVVGGEPLYACPELDLENKTLPGMCAKCGFNIFYGIFAAIGALVAVLVLAGIVGSMTDSEKGLSWAIVVILGVGSGPTTYWIAFKLVERRTRKFKQEGHIVGPKVVNGVTQVQAAPLPKRVSNPGYVQLTVGNSTGGPEEDAPPKYAGPAGEA